MNTLARPFDPDAVAGAPAPARAVFALLRRLRHGALDVVVPGGGVVRFGAAARGERPAAITLHDWRACAATLRSGDIGLAEAYIAGRWSTPDLAALLALFVANRDDLEAAVYGTWWGSLWHRLRHRRRANSRAGSRRNVHAHYDLGNDFYRLWLDPTMSYSSAWFAGGVDAALGDAQLAKVRRALDQCALEPGDRLLEIGCGWGGLADVAARERGLRVTGITLSSEQLDAARIRLAGALPSADLRLQDYRDVDDGPFDAVVSIEMFEAVGRRWWPAFFATVAGALAAGGRACLQTIVIRDDLFDRYARSTDFIQQYIFPGGLLPSRQRFVAAARDAGLEVEAEFAFGADYAETLRRWRERFLAESVAVRALGFDDAFVRTWEFYLAYCQAAFATGNTDVVQFTLRKA